MATINATTLTLLDHAKRLDPDGKVAAIAELLSQSNEMLTDMLYKEGNLPTGMRSTLRTQLPSVAFRRVNEGKAAAIFANVRRIGKFEAELREVFSKLVQAVHGERQMRQVRLDLHWAAGREGTYLNQFLALGRFEKYQF